MKKITIATMIGAFVLGLAASVAAAQQAGPTPDQGGARHRGGPGGQRGFEAMDTNNDGVITLDEWKAAGRREDRFAMLDDNHDGKVTREELSSFMEKMRALRGQNGGEWSGQHHEGQ